MCTKRGIVKKTALEQYSNVRQNGIIAINIVEGDDLLDVKLTDGNSNIIIGISNGKAIRFHEQKVRPVGRNSIGVQGVDFDGENDRVVGMVATSNPEATLLVVSEKGYGKRTDLEDYRITNRGGKGVTSLKVTEKTGEMVAIIDAQDNQDLIIMTKNGIVIRTPIAAMRVMGRATQGVRLIRLNETDEIASITTVESVGGEEIVATMPLESETDTTDTAIDTTPDAPITE
jgi:DNA gyrase subunit A